MWLSTVHIAAFSIRETYSANFGNPEQVQMYDIEPSVSLHNTVPPMHHYSEAFATVSR